MRIRPSKFLYGTALGGLGIMAVGCTATRPMARPPEPTSGRAMEDTVDRTAPQSSREDSRESVPGMGRGAASSAGAPNPSTSMDRPKRAPNVRLLLEDVRWAVEFSPEASGINRSGLISRFERADDLARQGWIQPAHRDLFLDELLAILAQLNRSGAPRTVHLRSSLDALRSGLESSMSPTSPLARDPKARQVVQEIARLLAASGSHVGPTPDAVHYLGVNPVSRRQESATIIRAAGEMSVTGTVASALRELGYADPIPDEALEAFLDEIDEVSPERRHTVREILNTVSGRAAKEDVARLIRRLSRAERLNYPVERVILSGHSGGSGAIYADGSEDGTLEFSALEPLGTLFPQAVTGVEDLMLSACYTDDGPDQYLRIFPNLRSIWYYDGMSPSVGTGSLEHIRVWEQATRGPFNAFAIDAARRAMARGGERGRAVRIWTRP